MPAAVDKFAEMALKSVRKYLEDVLGGDYSGVHVAGPDFDHLKVASGGVLVDRPLPYVLVVPDAEDTGPHEIGDAQVSKAVLFFVWVVCESYPKQMRRPSQVAQALWTADHDGVNGRIILYDFDVATPLDSGYFEVVVGPIAHSPQEIFTSVKQEVVDRLRHVSVIACSIDREKDREAALIEAP